MADGVTIEAPRTEWRCQAIKPNGHRCKRLLARVTLYVGIIEQKCPACGAMNTLQAGPSTAVTTLQVQLRQ